MTYTVEAIAASAVEVGSKQGDERSRDRPHGRGDERSDDATVEAIGHEQREVPERDPNHHPGEYAHRFRPVPAPSSRRESLVSSILFALRPGTVGGGGYDQNRDRARRDQHLGHRVTSGGAKAV